MIDFRYHIVSLISVFLALAVGIALGAGPLEETIGDSLTGQVEVLREDRDALRAELADTQSSLDRAAVYLEGAAPMLLEGTLAERRVAVISIGAVEEDARVGVEEQLVAAGATVSARVQVGDLWTDPTVEPFRESLADTVMASLDPAPTAGAGVEVRLAEALAQGLTSADPAAPDRLSGEAMTLLELLSTGESELVTLADPVVAPADAIVVASHLAVVTAARSRADGVLLAGGVATPGDLVTSVLEDGDLAGRISTVTGFRGLAGQVSVALGLNAALGGVIGHYGFGDGLTPVPEPVDLPDVDRSPVDAAASTPTTEG